MNWANLQEQIKADFELSPANLETQLREIPNIHNKYLRLYFKAKTELVDLEAKLSSLYRERYYYYRNDYDYNLDEKSIAWHIESDEIYQILLVKVNKKKALVNYFNQLVKKASQLSFDIKNIIEYFKFTNGTN